ncbi:MAG: ribose-phosphate pyrophosphokinase [Synergistaceae bacterium]|nr:ribose-phosphate pyrophosphokinase [Synergistaceae bacterium]
MGSKRGELRILSGTGYPAFARRICSELGIEALSAKHYRFSDGEIGLSIEDSVRGADVFVIQPTCNPVNENLVELFIMLDALKRASAHRINVVIPYFGYARQDRKSKPRDPISAKLMANLLTVAGADRVITADLHAGQIQGFFDIPVDHLTGMPLLASYFRENVANTLSDPLVVVAPDVGGMVRARRFAGQLKADLAVGDKRRSHEAANFCEVMDVIGDVEGKTVVMVDDIIDTAGTICNAAALIKERGAVKVFACATHGVLSGPALERLESSDISRVILTNTIPLPESKKSDKIVQLSIAPLFAEAILRVHSDRSVSRLFD